DRYTTSNMVHQMVKYTDVDKRVQFLEWLEDFEFVKFGLPRPDAVCLLDVPLDVTESLMSERTGKTGGETGDIHEGNRVYLQAVHNAYDELVERYQWHRISCAQQDESGTFTMRSIESIHNDIYDVVKTILR
ncbi:MAG: thymidylate kinase, partial [Veillonella sp.]|nr:thymidylate kinase [Veillonella sp.]